MTRASFTAAREPGTGGGTLRLAGRLDLESAAELRDELAGSDLAQLDLAGVESMDGAAAALIARAVLRSRENGQELALLGAEGRTAAVLELYASGAGPAAILPPPKRVGLAEQVGRNTLSLISGLRDALDSLGRVVLAGLGVLRHPSSMPWRSVGRLIERHGADGVPIVVLITFLVGLVTAFQSALQLAKFGADSFVADLVSLSITRELAPLMTAIVVAGRSGASIAAELGTMRVSEEVDALRTMGLDPHRYLVLPRVIALVVVTPILTLLADLVGIAGGLLVALTSLEVSWQGFLRSTREAVELSDVMGGLAKAVIFGGLVALIACGRGLATRGGAEGVGRATTSAVVISLFFLVMADAVFGVLFSLWGL